MKSPKLKYSQRQIDEVRRRCNIRQVIPDLKGRGKSQYRTCPECGADKKGNCLTTQVTDKWNNARCFKCGFLLKDPIDAEMYFRHVDFIEALESCASIAGIVLIEEKETEESTRKRKESFCDRQLRESGLTVEDVLAETKDNYGQISHLSPFVSGGVDSMLDGKVNDRDDEMLIRYYDLEGYPVVYTTKHGRKIREYVRVRWSNPEMHIYKGNTIKYQTMPGAPSKFYIPQKIREIYQKSEQLDTLFIQEGEKKAEKACKHGIPSIGIQGINNIGSREAGLIKDLQYLVQRCGIRRIVMVMDSDWNNLSSQLPDGGNIDYRPRQFAAAVVKFKEYVSTIRGTGADFDIYWGHVNANEAGDKGIDDLLCNTLKGRESELSEDIESAFTTHDGKGKWVSIHKITMISDHRIYDFWDLNDKDAFFAAHSDRLKSLKRVRFSKILYDKDEETGEFKASFAAESEQIWYYEYETKGEKEIKKVRFDTLAALSFVEENGFRRIHTADLPPAEYSIVRIEGGYVYQSGPAILRDLIFTYARQTTKDREILNALARSLSSWMSTQQIERLKMMEDNFSEPTPDSQSFYYRDRQIDITAGGVVDSAVIGPAWATDRINRSFRRIPLLDISKANGRYEVTFTADGEKCEFLQFLRDTSDFRKDRTSEPTVGDREFSAVHLVNKLTAIGYLLCRYRYDTESKAVVAMDNKLVEMSEAHGRTGKSMIGVAIKQMIPQTFISGKGLQSNDQFLFSNVNYQTRNIFIDDLKPNFDMKRLYTVLTSDLEINVKGGARFIMPVERVPKIFLTTNHAIADMDDSATARITYMAFSDYYNIEHTPIMKFGHSFFSQWDETQWLLFDNLMAECVMYYFISRQNEWEGRGLGMVTPPMVDLKKRQLRQNIGEAFLQWAQVYFDTETGTGINQRIQRKTLYDTFHREFPGQHQYVTASGFYKKIKQYCMYAGLNFNATKPNEAGCSYSTWRKEHPKGEPFIGTYDKSHGIEFFTVSTMEFSDNNPF